MLPPRLLSGTAVSTLGRVLGTAVSVVTVGVVTRGLASAEGGVAAYGAYAAVFAFLTTLAVVADGGLYLVFTRRAAAADAVTEGVLLRRTFQLRVLTLGGALLLVAGLVALLQYPGVIRAGILLGALGVAFQLSAQLTLGVFQKRLRMATPALAEVLGRLATLVVTLAVVRAQGGVLLYVGAYVVGAAVTVLWNVAGVARFLPLRLPPAPLRAVPSRASLFQEAVPLGLLLVCNLIIFRADSLLLSYLRPPEDLGWYALPYKILESLLFFPAMIGGLLFPAFARAAGAAADRSEIRQLLNGATTLFLLLAIPAVVLLGLLSPLMISWLGGPAFGPSVPILRVLAVALGALFFGNLFGNGAIALGAQRPLLRAAAGIAVANVLLNLLIIPRYSFHGAAWTTLGTEILSATTAFWIVRSRVGSLSPSPERWHTVSAGGLFLLASSVPAPLLLRAVLGLAVYAGSLMALGVLTPARLRGLRAGPVFAFPGTR